MAAYPHSWIRACSRMTGISRDNVLPSLTSVSRSGSGRRGGLSRLCVRSPPFRRRVRKRSRRFSTPEPSRSVVPDHLSAHAPVASLLPRPMALADSQPPPTTPSPQPDSCETASTIGQTFPTLRGQCVFERPAPLGGQKRGVKNCFFRCGCRRTSSEFWCPYELPPISL